MSIYYPCPTANCILPIAYFQISETINVMYEHRKQRLAPLSVFYRRVFNHITIAMLVLAVCLSIGILGYHYSADVPWLDALHNASMILSGMGPVVEMKTVAGKWFSSFYALFSGIVFITNIGIILAPALHRIFHRLHLEDN